METLDNTILPESPTHSKTLNLGFVGLGWIGLNRMERILENPLMKCAGIVEPVRENVEKAVAQFGERRIYETYEELLADKSIDGVVIATPSALHAKQTGQALQAGKAVFCQKPLGRNAKEVKRAIEASSQNNRLLSIDLSYRYTEAFRAVYDVIQNGEIGKIYAVDLIFHNAYGPDKPWFYDLKQSGGGCVLDLGIHMIDLALWSLNFPRITSLKSKLYSKGTKIRRREDKVEDFATAMLTTKNQTVINLQCSWHISAGQDAVIEAKFYGSEGGAAFKNINGSFYDFQAAKYVGTQKEILVTPPDNWGGRAGQVWAEEVSEGKGFDYQRAKEYLALAKVIDRIYGRKF